MEPDQRTYKSDLTDRPTGTIRTPQQIFVGLRLPVSRKPTRIPKSLSRHDVVGCQLSGDPEVMTQVLHSQIPAQCLAHSIEVLCVCGIN